MTFDFGHIGWAELIAIIGFIGAALKFRDGFRDIKREHSQLRLAVIWLVREHQRHNSVRHEHSEPPPAWVLESKLDGE